MDYGRKPISICITKGVFNTLGTVAVITGSLAPKRLKSLASKGKPTREGYTLDFFDKSESWSARIDATVHGNPKYHHNPHLHLVARDTAQGGISLPVKYFWQIIYGWFL